MMKLQTARSSRTVKQTTKPMKVDGKPTRPLVAAPGRDAVFVIDQRGLPHRFALERLADVAAVRLAISDMWVRGAPLIGAVAAYGMALAANVDSSDAALRQNAAWLQAARPTAVNLAWAVQQTVGVADAREGDRIRAMLEIADSAMTYRSRYLNQVQIGSVPRLFSELYHPLAWTASRADDWFEIGRAHV